MLHASGLVLEPLAVAHAAEMFEILVDPSLYRHLDDEPPTSFAVLRDVYARREKGISPDGRQRWLNWIVRADGTAIGTVQATLVSPRTAWIAYLFATDHQGRGHARAATAAMLAYLRDACGIETCLATVEADHARSIALLEALSFRRADTDEEPGEYAPVRLTETERLYVLP